jgi:hypothetical protein
MGEDPVIYSDKKKSHLNGAQYLHKAIPGTPSDNEFPVLVSYIMQGLPFDYRAKVYGAQWDGSVSPEDLAESHSAWDIRSTYDWLWDEYSGAITDAHLGAASLSSHTVKSFTLVVSSVPAPVLCSKGHTFGSSEIWAAGEAPDLGITLPYGCQPNQVICNGLAEPTWYRISNLYGHKTVEWPGSLTRPPINGAARVQKPLFNNCDCYPDIVRVGRYGAWQKGVLSHSAFDSTILALHDLP